MIGKAKRVVRPFHSRVTAEQMGTLAARDRGKLEVRTAGIVSMALAVSEVLVFPSCVFVFFCVYG